MTSTTTEREVFLDGWDSLRDSGIRPAFQSILSDDREARREFVEGAELLGLNTPKKPLQPQQLRVSDCLNGGQTFYGVLLPRRSSKTTTIFAFAIGRCMGREDFLVGFTCATTGIKTRTRFMDDIVKPLERLYPDLDSRPFKIVKSKGEERIEWPNGSRFVCLPPDGEKFRGDAYDLIIIDEAGEASPEMTEDLTEGYLPTLDTRPDALVIIAGTAAAFRTGNLLWDTLADGRDPENIETGIIEYSAPHDLVAEDLTGEDGAPAWELAAPYVLDAHPGIDTLTTLPVIERNFRKLKLPQFLREYLSVFPDLGASRGAIPSEAWARCARPFSELPPAPERFGMAMVVHHTQSTSALCAAWRDDHGRAVLVVLDHRTGVRWLQAAALAKQRKHKVDIVHDSFGPVSVEAEGLARKRPKPKLAPQRTFNITTAAALLLKDVTTDNAVHYSQEVLDNAVRLAGKRKVGQSGWAFGRIDEADDIIALEGVAMALRYYDDQPARQSFSQVA